MPNYLSPAGLPWPPEAYGRNGPPPGVPTYVGPVGTGDYGGGPVDSVNGLPLDIPALGPADYFAAAQQGDQQINYAPTVEAPAPGYLPGGTLNLPTPDQIAAAGNVGSGPTVQINPGGGGPAGNWMDNAAAATGGDGMSARGAPSGTSGNATGSKPFPYGPVLGTVGGIAGGVIGGPVGALAGRVGGTLLGKFLQNGGFNNLNLQAGGYNPNAPISRSNIPPFSVGAPVFNPGGQPGTGDHFAYQQSGSIMDTSRRGYDPNTVITNPIRPFGPGNYNPGRSFNQSSGYYGAAIAQSDQAQQAALQARMAEGGDAFRVLNDTLPNTPFFQMGGPAGAVVPAPPPMFAAAPLPTFGGFGPAGLPSYSLAGDVISNALPPKG